MAGSDRYSSRRHRDDRDARDVRDNRDRRERRERQYPSRPRSPRTSRPSSSSGPNSRPTSRASMNNSSNLNDTYNGRGVDRYRGHDTPRGHANRDGGRPNGRRPPQYTASEAQIRELAGAVPEDDILMSRERQHQIQSRQTGYQKRQWDRRPLSPMRTGADGTVRDRSYREKLQERDLEREEARVSKAVDEKKKRAKQTGNKQRADDTDSDDGTISSMNSDDEAYAARFGLRFGGDSDDEKPTTENKKRPHPEAGGTEKTDIATTDEPEKKKSRSRWGPDPAAATDAAEPAIVKPAVKKSSRWDVAPAVGLVPALGSGSTAAPMMPFVPRPGRNAPLSDEELDEMLPGLKHGYEILKAPPGYEPLPGRAPKHRVGPPPMESTAFMIAEPNRQHVGKKGLGVDTVGELQFFKPEDEKFFGKLAAKVDENQLSVAELRERKIMRLLLKVKNGTPAMRKTALRQITDGAKTLGAQALFDQLLPLLMERSLEDQERHLLVKVVDRVLYKLGELVRPYTHKILVVIEPLLIDQDFYARVEGKEIIANLAKAAGLPHMISVMRPDVDSPDEFVRNTTARAFAVVASALGIPAIMPFLRAICTSKKSWHARHTGTKIVQQCAIMMGCAVLPHLKGLVKCIGGGLSDEQTKVRTVTALAISALAEASAPYGIESFDEILRPLWSGARRQRGKGLAAFIQAVGNIIVLMDEEYAGYYTGQILEILKREFSSSEEDMKKVVLRVLSQCAATKGVTPSFIVHNILDDYFQCFWVRRLASEKRMFRLVIDTTVDLAKKTGAVPILKRILDYLKDLNEPFRKMAMETVEKTITALGSGDIDEDLEIRLIDGIITAFQQQTVDDSVVLNAFGIIVNSLGDRMEPYIPQIVQIIKHRLRDRTPEVRQQAAELVIRIAKIMATCDHEQLLQDLGSVLDESLGEEYPEVLASILGALRAIFVVVGVHRMQPPVRSLLPKLTPILKNRHEKVQENVIDLVGRIADRGPESVNAREWIRICFDLLDMLKAHKKGIRRASNNTFGFIAKAIGPSDVLSVLLNNLRVQERQSRVCTAVAIGIVAESCSPYTVIPSLMAEYRVPELNVQTGVLKALSFLFEYIGEMSKDYVYAVIPLLEDALIDRDQVHRQTAASVIKHIALGVVGLGCEDALIHLLNLLWPNVLETSPHVITRVLEAVNAIRNAVGNGIVLNYLWAGLFHPAKKVRTPYWHLYNECYVQSADAMVPYYPELGRPELKRHELFAMI